MTKIFGGFRALRTVRSELGTTTRLSPRVKAAQFASKTLTATPSSVQWLTREASAKPPHPNRVNCHNKLSN